VVCQRVLKRGFILRVYERTQGEQRRTFNESFSISPVLEAFLQAICDLLALEFELFGLNSSVFGFKY
jgi:hypothetical protein